MKVRAQVNGEPREDELEPRVLLVHYLREQLGLTSARVGCDTSNCGTCTVHVDGRATKSCTFLAAQADGRSVTTLEGLDNSAVVLRLRAALRGVLDCGYCEPGIVLAVLELLAEEDEVGQGATTDRVGRHLEGHLCRCTGGADIVGAIAALLDREREAGR